MKCEKPGCDNHTYHTSKFIGGMTADICSRCLREFEALPEGGPLLQYHREAALVLDFAHRRMDEAAARVALAAYAEAEDKARAHVLAWLATPRAA